MTYDFQNSVNKAGFRRQWSLFRQLSHDRLSVIVIKVIEIQMQILIQVVIFLEPPYMINVFLIIDIGGMDRSQRIGKEPCFSGVRTFLVISDLGDTHDIDQMDLIIDPSEVCEAKQHTCSSKACQCLFRSEAQRQFPQQQACQSDHAVYAVYSGTFGKAR